jgi:hypothetical protein
MSNRNKWKETEIEWLEKPTITGNKRYKVRTREPESILAWDKPGLLLVQVIVGIIIFIYIWNK